MAFVEIIRPCIAQGRRVRPGERLEVSENEARLLLGLRRAEICDSLLPVVIEEIPAKRSRRKPKSEGASTPSVDPVAVEVNDAPAAIE
jgi:hypothetical protein